MKLCRLLAGLALATGLALAQTPAGTTIKAELKTTLNTQHAHPGDSIRAEVRSDVKVHGEKLWPKGTMLTGTVLAVTAAESDKSPAHITIVFQQAARPGGEPQPLLAAIAKVEVYGPPLPMLAMPTPVQPPTAEADSDGSNGKMNTLGEQAVPSAVTADIPNAEAPRNQPAKIEVTHRDNRGSELLSTRGDLNLPSGTRIELKVLPAAAGSGSRPLLF